jgi:hypothetical protein
VHEYAPLAITLVTSPASLSTGPESNSLKADMKELNFVASNATTNSSLK